MSVPTPSKIVHDALCVAGPALDDSIHELLELVGVPAEWAASHTHWLFEVLAHCRMCNVQASGQAASGPGTSGPGPWPGAPALLCLLLVPASVSRAVQRMRRRAWMYEWDHDAWAHGTPWACGGYALLPRAESAHSVAAARRRGGRANGCPL